jgi:hypothetical protein
MPVTVPCTYFEAALPGWLALAGADLYAAGWRLAAMPPDRLPKTRQLPLPGGTRRARYKLLLGAAASGHTLPYATPLVAVPPQAAGCPKRLVVHLPRPAPKKAAVAVALACARGLPKWRTVPGPYPHRVCVSLRVPVRAVLERAVACTPGSTITGWVRLLLTGATA